MAKNIWVFCETRDGEIQNVALELLGVARELAEKTGEKVCALLLGHNVNSKAQELIAHGADQVYVVDDERLATFVTEPFAQAVTQIARAYEPSVILFGATSIGRDLDPRLFQIGGKIFGSQIVVVITASATACEQGGKNNDKEDG